MADVIVKKTEKLKGEVCAPPSKSYTQRMLIAAALSNGKSKISNPLVQKILKQPSRNHCFRSKSYSKEGCWTIEGAKSFKAPANLLIAENRAPLCGLWFQ